MKIITIGCLLALLATFIPSAVGADKPDIHEDAGTMGAAFLKIEAGSRPASMGGAFVGLADDANAVFYNPAGLTSIEYRELTAMQNFWFAGINNESISYVQRLGDGAFGVSFLGAFSKIEERSEPTEDPIRTFNASSFAIGLSYGHKLAKNVSLGGTVKFLSQQFDIEDWTGVAGDAGVLLGIERLRVGASIQNLGVLKSGKEEESLPMNIRVGGAFHVIFSEPAAVKEPTKTTQTRETKPSMDEVNTSEEQASPPEPRKPKASVSVANIIQFEPKPILTIVGDVNIPKSGYPVVHLGVENWFHDVLALRVGYSFSQGDNTNRGITAGIGLRAWGTAPLENINFQFDYAFAPDRRWDERCQ